MHNFSKLNDEKENMDKLNLFNKNYNKNNNEFQKILNIPRTNYYNKEKRNNNIYHPKINNNEYLKNSIYQNYINFINPDKYNSYKNPQNIYYEEIIQYENKYINTDSNYIPKIISKNKKNNKIIKNNYYFTNNNEHNRNKDNIYKKVVDLNKSNYETKYPMKFLSKDNSRNIFIQNFNDNYIINKKENNSHSKILKKNNNRIFNLSKIKHLNDLNIDLDKTSTNHQIKNKYSYPKYKINKIRNIKSNTLFGTSFDFHKKNNSINFQKINEKKYAEDYYLENNNNNNKKYINTYEKNKGRTYSNIFNDENNNYQKFNKVTYSLKNKTKRKSKEKYISKLMKFIDYLEEYYINSFHKYFDYFIKQLIFYNQKIIIKNKNSLLKRFQRVKNNGTFKYIQNNFSFKNDFTNNDIYDNINSHNHVNIQKYKNSNKQNIYSNNIYIPKKKLDLGANKNNLKEINRINDGYYTYRNFDNFHNYNNHYQNNLTFKSNKSELSNSKEKKYYPIKNNKENSVDKLNYKYNNSRYVYNNMNNNNLKENNKSNNSFISDKNISNLKNKSLVYSKPKTKRLNLKRVIIKNENNNNSINYSNTINNINSNYIYNNIFSNNRNINKNECNSIKNKIGLRRKIKSNFLDDLRDISNFPSGDILDNNNNIINNRMFINNDNEINEVIGNDYLIEEIIIKNICTYDKKLSVNIKYIISPRTKENFLKRKQRLRNNNGFLLNNEFNYIKPIHTDSIEIISSSSTFNSDNNFINKKYKIKNIIKENYSSENSNLQDDNSKNNKILNIINIIEEYKNKNYLYFYKFFFNQLNNIYIKNNNSELHRNNVFKNILDNFKNTDNKKLLKIKNIYNINKNDIVDENIYISDRKEHWKRNLFPDQSKDNKEKNNKKYNNDNINIMRKKLLDLNQKNNISSKRKNSIEEFINKIKNVKKKYDKNEQMELYKNKIIRNIIMRKYKNYYFLIWKKFNNFDKLNKKMKLFKNYLIRYIMKRKIIKNNKSEEKGESVNHKEEEVNKEEEEEEDDEYSLKK